MKSPWIYVSSVFCGALALGCASEHSGNDTQSSSTSGNGSGSGSGAPESATDAAVSESAPTMATTAGSSGEACSFLHCDDMTNDGGCDIYAQDCPEGQKCAAYADDGSNAWNAVHCVELTGTDQPGDACTSEGPATGIDSCIAGAVCWNFDMDGSGTCIALCTGEPEAPVCDPPAICKITADGVFNLCTSPCDPLLQDCPKANHLCIPNGDDFICVLDAGGEEGQANDPCEFSNVCDPGLVCLVPAAAGAGCDAAAGGCCTPFCKFPDGACPNPDQSCVQWFDPMMLPANDPQLGIGVCAVPV